MSAIITASILVSLFLSYYSKYWVPTKFTLDQFTISIFQIFAENLIKGNSYNNTALFYNWLHVDKNSNLFMAFGPLLYMTLAIIAVLSSRPHYISSGAFFILLGGFFSACVYLSQLTKELIVLLVIWLFYFSCHKRWSNLFWLAVAAGYAYYFRGYWYLVIAMYLWMLVIGFYAKRTWQVIAIVLAGLLAISVLHPVLIGGSIMQYRDSVNSGREADMFARTLITPFFTSRNVFADWLNCSLIWLQTVVPVRLLFSGSPQHLASGVMMLTTFSLILRGLPRFWLQSVQDPAIYRCVCLFLAFTAVQSTFEPDYGSMLKHMTPLLPLALVFICSQFKTSPLAGAMR